MGMFDTIIFDRPIRCPKCGAEICSDQTKAFECTLDDAATAVAVASSAMSSRRCEAWEAFTTRYDFALYRYILVGIDTDLEAAEARQRIFNFERLLLPQTPTPRPIRSVPAMRKRGGDAILQPRVISSGRYTAAAPGTSRVKSRFCGRGVIIRAPVQLTGLGRTEPTRSGAASRGLG